MKLRTQWFIKVLIDFCFRACRRGRWDGQQGKCIKTVPRMKPRGSCSSPPFINNGYFLSERYSGEKPYVLPVSGNYQHTYEVRGDTEKGGESNFMFILQ